MKLIDISGNRFGRLTVLKKMPPRPSKAGGSDWLCACDCGQQLVAIGSNLRSGGTTSCGCVAREWSAHMGANKAFIAKRAESAVIHGQKRRGKMTVEYRTWLAMKRRCYDKKSKDYPNWGGRGITVCEEWDSSFETFFEDMGLRPSQSHSIDRLDSDKEYAVWNCRWATQTEQASENRRGLLPIVISGIAFKNRSEACRHFGVSVTVAAERIKRGVDPVVAISTVGPLYRPRTRESYLRKSSR